jgi:hypothetical protein
MHYIGKSEEGGRVGVVALQRTWVGEQNPKILLSDWSAEATAFIQCVEGKNLKDNSPRDQ